MPDRLMLLANRKLQPLDVIVAQRARLCRSGGGRLVMTNGCFDLLHTGHIYFLQHARALGDRLLVALNSDRSVRALKGEKRPVQSETQRAFALAALECVDDVVVFDRPDLVLEIQSIQPDVYTKAGDYTLERLHKGERAALEACHARIEFLPFLEGFSTTALIRKIVEAGGLG